MNIFKDYADFLKIADNRAGHHNLPRSIETAESLEIFSFIERGLQEKKISPDQYIDWTRSLFGKNLAEFTDQVRAKVLLQLKSFLENGDMRRDLFFGPASVYIRNADEMISYANKIAPDLIDFPDLSETFNIEYVKYANFEEDAKSAAQKILNFVLEKYSKNQINLEALVDLANDYDRLRRLGNDEEKAAYLKPVVEAVIKAIKEPYSVYQLSEAEEAHNQKIIEANGGIPMVRIQYGQPQLHPALVKPKQDNFKTRIGAVSSIASDIKADAALSNSLGAAVAAFIQKELDENSIDAKQAAQTGGSLLMSRLSGHPDLQSVSLKALEKVENDNPEEPGLFIEYLKQFRHGDFHDLQQTALRMALDAIEKAYLVNSDFGCNHEDKIFYPLSELDEKDAKIYAGKFLSLFSERGANLNTFKNLLQYDAEQIVILAPKLLSQELERFETDPPRNEWDGNYRFQEFYKFLFMLPDTDCLDIKVSLLDKMKEAAKGGNLDFDDYAKLSQKLVRMLPEELRAATFNDTLNVLEDVAIVQNINEKHAAKVRAGLLPQLLKLAQNDNYEDAFKAAASVAADLGAEIATEDGRASLGRLREVFRRFQGEIYKTNSTVVWMGANKRRDPAIAVYGDDGEPILAIFNLKGRLSEVRDEIENRYPQGHARRSIFETFVQKLG